MKLCKMHIFFSYQSYLRPILRIKSPLCLHYITFRPKNISAFSRNRPHRGSYNEWSTNKSQNLVCNFHPIYNIPECPSKKKMFKSYHRFVSSTSRLTLKLSNLTIWKTSPLILVEDKRAILKATLTRTSLIQLAVGLIWPAKSASRSGRLVAEWRWKCESIPLVLCFIPSVYCEHVPECECR